jgi:hypothetical protein
VLDDDSRNLNSYGISAGAVVDLSTLLLDGADEVNPDAPARPPTRRREHKPEKGFKGSLLQGDFNNLSSSDASENNTEGVECPACTFMNYSGAGSCEMCNAQLQHPKRTKSEP